MNVKLISAGFTLIELLIAIAVIAILAMLSLPAYQDYLARTQVAEGLSLSNNAKNAITLFHSDFGRFPVDNKESGLPNPASITGRYVDSVRIEPMGGIAVTFSSRANKSLDDAILTFQIADDGGSLHWRCGGLNPRYLPRNCRSTH
jgi:type IV pilus assembly protein PilA